MYTCFVDFEKHMAMFIAGVKAVGSTAGVRSERSAIGCGQIVVQTVRSLCSCHWHENKAF